MNYDNLQYYMFGVNEGSSSSSSEGCSNGDNNASHEANLRFIRSMSKHYYITRHVDMLIKRWFPLRALLRGNKCTNHFLETGNELPITEYKAIIAGNRAVAKKYL